VPDGDDDDGSSATTSSICRSGNVSPIRTPEFKAVASASASAWPRGANTILRVMVCVPATCCPSTRCWLPPVTETSCERWKGRMLTAAGAMSHVYCSSTTGDRSMDHGVLTLDVTTQAACVQGYLPRSIVRGEDQRA
jgi:hypothetical protein